MQGTKDLYVVLEAHGDILNEIMGGFFQFKLTHQVFFV